MRTTEWDQAVSDVIEWAESDSKQSWLVRWWDGLAAKQRRSAQETGQLKAGGAVSRRPLS